MVFKAADSRVARYLAHCAYVYVPGHTNQGVRGRCHSHKGSVAPTYRLRNWPAYGGAYHSLRVPNGRWQRGKGGLYYGAYWWRHHPRSPSVSSFSLVGGFLKHTSAPTLNRQHTHTDTQMATVMALECRRDQMKVFERGLIQIQILPHAAPVGPDAMEV